MFAADPQVVPIAVTYGRGSMLRDRLLAAAELQVAVDERSSIVIDPDSRLTQLGLIPICDDSRYFFFESRAFGGGLEMTLSELIAEWLTRIFDIEAPQPFVAPSQQQRIADITVSWGVGENANKRIDDEFELAVLAKLLTLERPILLDRGAGGEEAERVNLLVDRLGFPINLHLHDGSYASFASHILQSSLYVGYDSAGQHVAAVGGVPLISVFTGYACERMLARWRPNTRDARVVAVDKSNEGTALERTFRAIEEAGAERKAASRGSAN
jgi:hypothetical protein